MADPQTPPNSAPFPVTPEDTAVTLAYRNADYIADEALPRIPVGLRTYSFNYYAPEDTYSVPDSRVGRRGRPNEVELTAKRDFGGVEDHGLDDPIPQDDIDQAQQLGTYDPVGRAVEQLTDYIALGREVRTANVVFNPASYLPENQLALAGSSQFSNATTNPIPVLLDMLERPLMRPNVIVIGSAAWTQVRQNPFLVQGVRGGSAVGGVITAEQFAAILEVDRVLIGKSRLNVARKGQAANLQRVWGKHLAMLYVNKLADTRQGLTFGWTAQYGQRVAGRLPDGNIGMRGGLRVRVGETVQERVIAPAAAAFLQNVVP